MKKLLIFIFIFVILVSCIVFPCAFADTVTGGSEIVDSPYKFTFTFPTVLATLCYTTDFSTSNNNQYALINNFTLILEQDVNTYELSMSSTFDNSIGYTLPYVDSSILRYKSYFSLYPINGFYTSSSSFSNTIFLANNSQDIFVKVRSFYGDKNTSSIVYDSYLSFSVFYTSDFTLSDLSRREVFFDTDINGIVVRYYSLNNHYLQFTFFNYNYIESFNSYWIQRYGNYSNLDSLYNLGTNVLYYITSLSDDDNFNIGYSEGIIAGESIGYDKGYQAGEEYGYNRGFSAGINSNPPDAPLTFSSFFENVLSMLDVKLFGIISLSTLCYIALAFLFVKFMFNLFK